MAAKTKKEKKEIVSHLTKDALDWFARLENDDVKKDLKAYYELLQSLSSTASKGTHYDKLNEWSDEAYGYIHTMLKKYGFKNGEPEENKKNVNASFWWAIYGALSSIHYSPYLKTQVALHHSSAWERNEAMIAEMKVIVDKI